MAKDKKTPRPRAETPKGFRDYFGTDVTERTEMLHRIAGVYHRYGFDALESSAVETVEALGKFLPDVDRPNEGVFAWQEADDGDRGDWLALRYDLTAPLARVYAQHRNDLPTPYRRYAMGPVWRNEKPGPGRFRQFYQCDADTVGTASVAADAEICAMLADTLEEVGIPRGDYLIRVNNRKVLNGVLEVAMGAFEPPVIEHGLADMMVRPDVANAILRSIDKFDKVGEAGVRALLGKGRLDASGAYIDGVGLSDAQAEPVIAFLTSKGKTAAETLDNLRSAVGSAPVGAEGVDELSQIADLLAAGGYGPDRIVIDPAVVRGLGYYTGPVFEAHDRSGTLRAICGGGRYDRLLSSFGGKDLPATGFGFGDMVILELLKDRDLLPVLAGSVQDVVFALKLELRPAAMEVASRLRAQGRSVDLVLEERRLKWVLKHADRAGAERLLLLAPEEWKRGFVKVRDLATGAESEVAPDAL